MRDRAVLDRLEVPSWHSLEIDSVWEASHVGVSLSTPEGRSEFARVDDHFGRATKYELLQLPQEKALGTNEPVRGQVHFIRRGPRIPHVHPEWHTCSASCQQRGEVS